MSIRFRSSSLYIDAEALVTEKAIKTPRDKGWTIQ